MELEETFNIVVGVDKESILGYDQDAINNLDVEATLKAYQFLVEQAIKHWYPDVNVTFAWDGNTNVSEYPWDWQWELKEDIDIIVNDVYLTDHKFWVWKEE